tara:strand:+ start:28 stop:177 length:150 start_codon:yes stop_codon:yes gene_type:complete
MWCLSTIPRESAEEAVEDYQNIGVAGYQKESQALSAAVVSLRKWRERDM